MSRRWNGRSVAASLPSIRAFNGGDIQVVIAAPDTSMLAARHPRVTASAASPVTTREAR
jgi:hypothetical protein